MVTTSENGFSKPKEYASRFPLDTLSFTSLDTDPTSFTKAIKFPEWKDAMKSEYDCLMSQTIICPYKAWILVPYEEGMNVIASKWVFKTKRIASGDICPYKARVVVRSSH